MIFGANTYRAFAQMLASSADRRASPGPGVNHVPNSRLLVDDVGVTREIAALAARLSPLG
jgi:hypothetical protein